MAVSTDPLQRSGIRQLSQDTGARYVAPRDNQALALGRALGDIAPGVAALGDELAQKNKDHQESLARRDAVVAKGAALSDATRLGIIRPSQNPWYVSAYKRESAGIRAQDDLGKLATDSQTWDTRNDPTAFADEWRTHVADLAKGYGDEDSAKGFLAAEGQATQQALATNQAINSQRIQTERTTNLGILSADSLIRTIQGNAGKITGAQAYAALAPAREQWFATGGDAEGWQKIMVHAVTTASYSIRSPQLIDLLKAPELMQGPGDPTQDRQYGDGSEPVEHTADPTSPLPATPSASRAGGPVVSTRNDMRLQPPAMGRITNTFAQHQARNSAGVDIAVPVGTKLSTPVSGIARVGHDKKSGLFVAITSEDGKVYSSVAHLNVANVTDGQHVQAGEMIAMSGMSGHTTGPHVHWRVKVDGKDVDPLGYHFAQQATDRQRASNDEAPALAAAPTPEAPKQLSLVHGASLYDMPGVADAAESDRYRITSSLDSESSSRIQQIMNERKLKGIEATDRLYETYGTRLLTGDVPTGTIVDTLSKGGYAPQVIAEVLNNMHSAVADTAGLATAHLSLNSSDPVRGKAIFDLGVEARTKGYSADLESRVGKAVLSGDLSAGDGMSIIGEATSKSHQAMTDARAAAGEGGAVPGTVIKKYSQIKRGVDAAAAIANAAVGKLRHGGLMTPGEMKVHKQAVTQTILSYLDDHPGDFAGAEQAARDYEAWFINSLIAQRAAPRKPQAAAAPGANPRR